MLVLSRQCGEEIILTIPPSTEAQEVTVAVVDIRGDKVRVGVEAPICISVHRAEVQDRVVWEKAMRAKEAAERQALAADIKAEADAANTTQAEGAL